MILRYGCFFPLYPWALDSYMSADLLIDGEYCHLESSKMKCNTLSGKLFFTIKMALTKSVAYESLYSIEI